MSLVLAPKVNFLHKLLTNQTLSSWQHLPFECFQASYLYQSINCISMRTTMQSTVWFHPLSGTFNTPSPTYDFPNRLATPATIEPQPSVHGGCSPMNYQPYAPVYSSASSSDMPMPMDVDFSAPPRHNAKQGDHDVRNGLRQGRWRRRQERGQRKYNIRRRHAKICSSQAKFRQN